MNLKKKRKKRVVSFRRSKNYMHSSLLDEDGIYRPKPILVVGTSNYGKSTYVEKSIEEIEDNIKNTITISLIDVSDTFEAALSMFQATEKNHLKMLDYQMEEPEGRKKLKLWCFFGKGLKEWQSKSRKLPDMEIVTLGAKKVLQRQESLFLLEADKESKAVRLMMACGDELKKNEDLKSIIHHGKRLTKRQYTYYMGKKIESDKEPVGDSSDLKDVMAVLKLFDNDRVIMPEDFKYNFNVNNMFKEPGTRHIIVYKGLKKDEKLRDFVFFHIFNEIARNINYCKYPVIIHIEETQSKAPFKGLGHKAVLSRKVGDLVGTLRKTGRGVSIFMVGRSWSGIAEEVRSECSKQILFHLEQDDMLKFVKARSLGKKAKEIIENLKVGEYVHRGHETRVVECKMPRHGHKHPGDDFIEIYKKFFPERMKSYSEIIKEIEDKHKEIDKVYDDIIKADIEKKKAMIRKEMRQKKLGSKAKEEVEKLKEEEKLRRLEDRQKRDSRIIEIYKEMQLEGKKISYRNIAEEVTRLGFKASHQTVKTVLDDLLSTKGGQENTV